MAASRSRIAAGLLIALALIPCVALAQITTGTVTGNVKDPTGAVIPGATVVLTSEARGTQSAPTVTNENGDYVFPNVTADTYTVEVTLEGFKTVKRSGIAVSGGDRVGIPALVLEPGALAETITVVASSPLVQTQSGERSYAVSSKQIETLPFARNNFTSLTAFTPGVVQTGASAGGTRLGGASQNNIMMDGISAMDTGNNGQMLNMNVDAIGEVKILTQGYQAEFGRSSGLQITAVTKSGTNRFRGSGYDIQTNSDWDSNSWVNLKNGDPKLKTSTKTLGYTIGGPVGKPGGDNKLFFFYSHEYRPVTAAINGGNPVRIRVPTALERAGDFSQTRDNTGALFNLIKDPLSTLPCVAGNTGGCFQDGGVLGKIPANRLYPIGQTILGRYPLPNVNQSAGQNYNYEVAPGTTENLTQQPSIRVDYQLSQKLRFTGKYSGQRARKLITPGTIQGFNDMQNPYPFITNYGATVDYQINNSTFLEGTYGFIRNQLAGGGSIGSPGGSPALPGGIFVNESANRLSSIPGFPLLYPGAGDVDPRSYAYGVLTELGPVWFDGSRINLPPAFAWGSRIVPTQTGTGGTGDLPGPPNQLYPGFLNINRTQDVAISLTKVWGSHTSKAGLLQQPQLQGAEHRRRRRAEPGVPGLRELRQRHQQRPRHRLRLRERGGRRVHAVPPAVEADRRQHDLQQHRVLPAGQLEGEPPADARLRPALHAPAAAARPVPADVELLRGRVAARLGAAPLPRRAAATARPCARATPATPSIRATGQIVTAPGAANSAALIGTVVPNTGNVTNGVHQAGDGIADTSYVWPALVVAPRFGAAYDLTGDARFVLRGGGGLFFDRPDGNTVFSIPGNPPISTAQDLRNGQLSTLGTGLSSVGVPSMITFQYDAGIPSSWQWQGGVQMALPWSAMIDISYVGNHGFNRLRAFQGGANGAVDLNAVDFGAAYLPQNQDPTLGAERGSGRERVHGEPAPRVPRLQQHQRAADPVLGRVPRPAVLAESPLLPTAWGSAPTTTSACRSRAIPGCSSACSTRRTARSRSAPIRRSTEQLNENLAMQRHVIKSFAVWDIPAAPAKWGSVVKAILSDWQLSGVLTAGSAYRPGAIQANGATQTNPTNADERPLRHHLHVSERRHEHEPDRLAGLRGQDRLPRRSGIGLLERPVPAVQHGGGHRADATAASASSRGGISSAAARTTRSTCRSPGTSGSAASARSSSGSTCSTCSTPSSTTTGTTT